MSRGANGMAGKVCRESGVATRVSRHPRTGAAGKVPGITKQTAVFAEKDTMPHASALGSALGGMCHFAAIYCMSPEGLPKTKRDEPVGRS